MIVIHSRKGYLGNITSLKNGIKQIWFIKKIEEITKSTVLCHRDLHFVKGMTLHLIGTDEDFKMSLVYVPDSLIHLK